MKTWILLSLLISTFVSLATCQKGFVKLKAASTNSSDPQITFSSSKQFNCTGYMGVISNPVGHFHVYYPETNDGSCNGWAETNATAILHDCKLATNGGPFSFSRPSCLGNIVSDGKLVQIQDTTNQNFGLTKDGFFILGSLTSSDIRALQFDQLMTGFGWLVYDNKIMPDEVPILFFFFFFFKTGFESDFLFFFSWKGGKIAPRTMIGVNTKGELILVEVDGIEKYNPPLGLTLYQAAQWMKSVGAYYAINLDGGGSSAFFYNGEIVDFPTCQDVPVECVRPVTTITCVK